MQEKPISSLMHHLLQENAVTEIYLPFLPHTPITYTKQHLPLKQKREIYSKQLLQKIACG